MVRHEKFMGSPAFRNNPGAREPRKPWQARRRELFDQTQPSLPNHHELPSYWLKAQE